MRGAVAATLVAAGLVLTGCADTRQEGEESEDD